jgi:MobA/MobL family
VTRPDSNLSVPPGGRAASSNYHLSFRSGSRSGGACARAAHAYITRADEYDDAERDAAVYTESDHMPVWAQNNPREYWDAADLYERANGRLYVSADFALPRDLSEEDQVALAHSFAQELTAGERLPYTLAIHAGRDVDGQEHHPHAHLMISERQNDGIERSREEWFRRANRAKPGCGGAPKSRTFHGREWMERARERWAELTNRTLERCGREDRVDHRSYERQGLDREPGRHYGPSAAHMIARGIRHDRLDSEVDRSDALTRLDNLERELQAAMTDIARGGGRSGMGHDGSDGSDERRARPKSEPDRARDSGPER